MKQFTISTDFLANKDVRDNMCIMGAIIHRMEDSPDKQKLLEAIKQVDKVHMDIWDQLCTQNKAEADNACKIIELCMETHKDNAALKAGTAKWRIGIDKSAVTVYTKHNLKVDDIMVWQKMSSNSFAKAIVAEFVHRGIEAIKSTDDGDIVYIYLSY